MATYVHNENCLTPVMTADDAPPPCIVSASSYYAGLNPYRAFNQVVVNSNAESWAADVSSTGWLKFNFGVGNSEVASSYTVSCGDGDSLNRAPKTWTLRGSNNDADWDTLDTQTDVSVWTTQEMRTYDISIPAAYRYYKLDITASQGGGYLTVGEVELIGGVKPSFIFTNPTPAHLSTVYGTTEQLFLTATVSGAEPNYVYDASFYDEFAVQIGTTVSGVQSGDQAASNAYLSTPSGIDYGWCMTATTSGEEDTSSTYTFHNRFLASGTTEVNGVLASGIDVRLYSRDTGELVGSSVSTVSGVFDIETQCNAESYCVALSPYTDTNSLIYDFLEPGD